MTSKELRERRIALGWSRQQLAIRIGVSPSQVSDWEEGAAPITCPAALSQILHQEEDDHIETLPRRSIAEVRTSERLGR